MSNGALAAWFVFLWLATFLPAWYFLIRLTSLASARTSGTTIKLIGFFIAYVLVIVLPYAFLLLFGGESPELFRIVIWAILTATVVIAVGRIFLRSKLESFLWWLYGFVYDGLAAFYPYQELVARCTQLLEVTPADEVLDLGAGIGNPAVRMLQNEPKQLTLVDNSSTMLRKAKKKIGTHSEVRFVLDSIETFLEHPGPQKYSKVLLINVLYALHDREVFWRKLQQITTDHCRVVMTSSDKGGSFGLIRHHMKNESWWKLFTPKLLAIFIIDSVISVFAKDGTFHFISEDQMANEFKAEGWSIVHKERAYGSQDSSVNILFVLEKSGSHS